MEHKVFVVIPAYNEGKIIQQVVKEVKEYTENIVVVDDGSSDGTHEQALLAKVTVLRHIINRGQGAAIQTGIDYALLHGADIIVTFDADGQHSANEIQEMVEPIIKGECNITIGSRFLGKYSNMPLNKKILLKLAIQFTGIVSRIYLTDAHNGFRAMSKEVANLIYIKQDGMAHASEIIDQIAKFKIKFREIPVSVKYTSYSIRKGQSPLNAFRIAFNLLIAKIIR